MRSDHIRRSLVAAIVGLGAMAVVGAQHPNGPVFRADDPVQVDDDRALDAGRAVRDVLGNWTDFVINTFLKTGERAAVRAVNVNTLDEVPDSSWFTNRLVARPMTLDEIVRGPDRVQRLEVPVWEIVEGKDSGRQPGFRAVDPRDPTRHVYQIEFDPRSNPELATGAEIIGTAIYHALGYNVVDVYLVDIDLAALRIAPGATISVNGRRRPFTRRDLDAVLANVARKPDGRYRGLASRFADGRNMGPFRYAGTRPDDPNDIYPHEHRRELRGNRVFAAWLNHDDSRSINTLDMLEGPPGRQSIRHYMFDFGSIMGSGTNGDDLAWVGHEDVLPRGQAWRTLASLGLYRRPYLRVKPPGKLPAAGNFTADAFRPERWTPHYPNPAFRNMRADDAFWAARRLAALSPEAITAIVQKARYTDPHVTDHVVGTLLRRRALALQTWLTGINPLADARIEDGVLHFANVACDAGLTEAAAEYELSWFGYDNALGEAHASGFADRVTTPSAPAPPVLLHEGEYIGVDVRTLHPRFASWSAPVRFYFRRAGDGWRAIGLERDIAALEAGPVLRRAAAR